MHQCSLRLVVSDEFSSVSPPGQFSSNIRRR
jgi:hypothetical protein